MDSVYTFSDTTGEMFINGIGQGTPFRNTLFRTVRDNGGNDTYDFSNYIAFESMRIDLRPGDPNDPGIGWTDVDVGINFQPARLNGGSTATLDGDVWARGQLANAMLFNGDTRSLIENAIAGAGDDTVLGNQGRNRLEGRGGVDSLAGLDGDDTLIGGQGAGFVGDTLDGGNGTDLASYADSGEAVRVDLSGVYGKGFGGTAQRDVLISVEDIIGTGLNDTITGTAGVSNSLQGGGANDVLDGRGGIDLNRGGTGDDTIFAHAGDQLADGGLGSFDTIVGGGNSAVFDFLTRSYSVDGVALFQVTECEGPQGGTGADRFRAAFTSTAFRSGGGNDALIGDSGDDTLDGNEGMDSIKGALGADILFGGDDTLLAGGGADRPDGGTDDDVLVGGTGADELRGSDGNDILSDHTQFVSFAGESPAVGTFVASEADRLLGGNGDDFVYASGGGDWIEGAAGVDGLLMSFAHKPLAVAFTFSDADPRTSRLGGVITATVQGIESLSITAGGIRDNMIATRADYGIVFDGGLGNDLLRGAAGGDVLIGAGGNDRLYGNGGDDILVGSAGRDTLVGGVGADLFRWDVAAEGRDRILGFVSGEDRLSIDAPGFGGDLVEDMDLDATGRLVSGSASTERLGQFLYDQGTVTLRWGVESTRNRNAVLIATLDRGTVLAASDFLIVA